MGIHEDGQGNAERATLAVEDSADATCREPGSTMASTSTFLIKPAKEKSQSSKSKAEGPFTTPWFWSFPSAALWRGVSQIHSTSIVHTHTAPVRDCFKDKGYQNQGICSPNCKTVLKQKKWPFTSADVLGTFSKLKFTQTQILSIVRYIQCIKRKLQHRKLVTESDVLTSCWPLGPHPAYWSFALLTSGGSRLWGSLKENKQAKKNGGKQAFKML